nr:capsid [Mamastrovirus 22]
MGNSFAIASLAITSLMITSLRPISWWPWRLLLGTSGHVVVMSHFALLMRCLTGFGGEDQKSDMAGDKPNASAKAAPFAKEVAKEVVKEEKKTQARRRKWYKPRRQQNQPQQQSRQRTTVNKQVAKKLKQEGLEGPRPRFSVRVSATIGKIGPNKEQGPELQISTFLHPSLMKEPNDGTNFGPLQAASAQWGLWRLADLKIRCTPLVGPSAVTGSVYRLSLNLTQSPGNTSWGGLGARKHIDVPVGKQSTWSLHRGDLAGPRQTWWMTDTNEEGGQSCGPMVEIHGLGKTSSTYKDADWVGDLFIVEVVGRWEFTNYNAKPALGTLDRVTEDVKAGIEVGSDGIMTMTIPQRSNLAKHMSTAYEKLPLNALTVGETIWQIVDEGAGLISSAVPPPFGWLIKGGWWFVKKAIGRSNADETYYVYASLADAQNNKPVEATPFSRIPAQTTIASTQINAPNTGPSSSLVISTPSGLLPEDLPSTATTFEVVGHVSAMFSAGQTTSSSPVINNVFPVLGQDASNYAFSIMQNSTQGAGKGMGCLIFQSEPVFLRLNLDTSSSTVDNIFLLDDTPGIGWTVDFNLPSNPINNCADVLAYKHEKWGDNLKFSSWLVRFTKAIPESSGNFYCLVSAPVISSVNQAPVTIVFDKVATPKLSTSSSLTHMRVYVSSVQPGTYGVIYTLGNYNVTDATGVASAPTLTGPVNDRVVSGPFRTATGITPISLTTQLPTFFPLWANFFRPAFRPTMIDTLMEQIQHRFGLKPVEPDNNSDDESDAEPTAASKFAKHSMYDALRDSDWDHVDADALIHFISKASNRPRGHAE